MQKELAQYRRLLAVTYRRYAEADRRFVLALGDMRAWFPSADVPYRGTIGAPGSRVRRLYQQRERALLRLQAAQRKFEAAKARRSLRRARSHEVLFLSVRRG